MDAPGFTAYKNIRRDVFVTEQEVDESLEWEYEDEAVHFLAYYDTIPAGTARYRRTEKGIKLERFAVLPAFRGKGIAAALLLHVLEETRPMHPYIYLHAQLSAVGLYEKHGFEKEGNLFEEATIQHYKMVLK